MQLDCFDYLAPDDTALQRNDVTQMLNEVYTQESSELDPVLFQMQIAALVDETW